MWKPTNMKRKLEKMLFQQGLPLMIPLTKASSNLLNKTASPSKSLTTGGMRLWW